MNRFQRTYAQHSAWTPADPLAGLDPAVRRAILLQPPTWRERWKMRPLTSPYTRREAMLTIIAERRLAYELKYDVNLAKAPPQATEPAPAPDVVPPSPYYRYRLDVHRDTMQALANERHAQDADDLAINPDYRLEAQRRATLSRAWAELAFERARLDLREQQLLRGDPAEAEDPSPLAPSPRRRRSTDRSR